MGMEQQVWKHCQRLLDSTSNFDENPPSLQLIASLHSLIVNPSTSESTLSAVLNSLLALLLPHNHHPPFFLPQILRLALQLAKRCRLLAPQIFHSIASNGLHAHQCPRLAAESLSTLLEISEIDESLGDELEWGDLFVSLCFRPSVSVRAWLLLNFEKFRVRPFVVLSLFLGFTKDPYPNVRRIALDGSVKIAKLIECDDDALAQGCFCHAVELLRDREDSVRSAAVRAVSEWGQMLVESSHPPKTSELSDALFVQLCPMARDMTAQVRIEAFDCLSEIEMVTSEVLLQSLSKKVLLSTKQKKSLNHLNSEQLQLLASSVAGAYAHGLEDEFSEVREAACRSLRRLTVISPEFSAQAVNWLVDMLNDDSFSVRLCALETMHHMAISKCLKVLDAHMLMFLGTLLDSDSSVRSTARKVLQMITFSSLEMFRVTVDGVLQGLESYPQDEADVIALMFTIGQNHGVFVIDIFNKISEEMALLADGKIRSNSGRQTTLLALAISAPFSNNLNVCRIPPRVYSCAFTLLRKISDGLIGIMDESTLLDYLLKCSEITCSSMELKEESFLPLLNHKSISYSQFTDCILEGMKISVDPMSIHLKHKDNVRNAAETELEGYDKVIKYAQSLVDKVEDLWLLAKSGCIDDVLRTSRGCKQQLQNVVIDWLESGGLHFFLLQYFDVIELLAKVWMKSQHQEWLTQCTSGELIVDLTTLELTLRELRFRIIGWSVEEELHILELILFTHVVRLSAFALPSTHSSLSKLSAALSRVEFLLESGLVEPSMFIVELQILFSSIDKSVDEGSSQMVFKKLLGMFNLKPLMLYAKFNCLKAEVHVPGNDSENPLPFTSGLPVGVPLKITLYNVSSQSIIWLKMKSEEGRIQFVYLDHNQFGDCIEVRILNPTVPLHDTPRAGFFTLKVSVGIECSEDIIYTVQPFRVPKYELAYLCRDVEVCFSNAAVTDACLF